MLPFIAEALEKSDLNCTPPAINEFPPDGFTAEERKQGWIAIHACLAIYFFIMLAIVCDDYFIPAVERLCLALNLSTDVAGATFMAIATSAPEFFVNIVGTFITEGDIGIGTIVGSAVFNALGVTAVCGIVSGVTIKLDWWPLTRDCSMYAITVTALTIILWDSTVYWYEALFLVCMYSLYLLVFFNNTKLQQMARESPTCNKVPCFDMTVDPNFAQEEDDLKADDNALTVLCRFPSDRSFIYICWWIIIYPTHLIYFLTIPDCRIPRLKDCYPITFIMCCVWISILSYLAAWMITAFGDTFGLPDTVAGITILAVGTSIPEAVSSVIVAKRGYGSMAVCNSIGSNTFDVLICLGAPWLIKSLFFSGHSQHSIIINSSGLAYSTCALLTTLFLLYASFAVTNFTLGTTVGWACLILYLAYVILASMIEMNVFFVVNLPQCEVEDRWLF